MIKEDIKKLVEKLILELSKGNYSIINQDPYKSRISPEMMKKEIEEYGERLVELPEGKLDEIEVIYIKDNRSNYAMDVDLWTEKGESDLTLSLTITEEPEVLIEIDNLHIL